MQVNYQVEADTKPRKFEIENILNGNALEKLKQLVKNQNGDITYIEDTNKFTKAKYIIPVVAEKDGIVRSLKAEEVGKISVNLGAGRIRKEDKIDNSVGIILEKKIGDKVQKGETLAYIHANEEEKGREASKKLKEIYIIN